MHDDWYRGDYIKEIARDYAAEYPEDAGGDDLDAIRRFAVAYLRGEQDADLRAFGVKFDSYYLESSLYTDGKVEETVRMLVAAGRTYEADGALWLRTTEFGDDKDRVMRKSDGTYTYFVPDVAYHLTKFRRGYASAVNVQGADHHSTVTRVRAGLQALAAGIPEGYPDYVLHQMVTVMKGGEEVKISKRAGSYVTVRDLVEEAGRDAVRWFFIMRKSDSHLVFDIDLAKSQSDENPVYYVQYAHARLTSVLREWGGDEAQLRGADLSGLGTPHEAALAQALAQFPEVLERAAREFSPHLVSLLPARRIGGPVAYLLQCRALPRRRREGEARAARPRRRDATGARQRPRRARRERAGEDVMPKDYKNAPPPRAKAARPTRCCSA